MIRAYSELYLGTVCRSVAALFDVAAYCERMNPDGFADMFSTSPVARGIESASPRYLAGMSPQDMFAEIILRDPKDVVFPEEQSDAYWAGYVATYSQWFCGCTFRDLFNAMPFSRIVSLYRTFHEMEISHAVGIVADTLRPVSILKELRESSGMSQSTLSLLSGVPIRSIRAYEQGTVELCKAQGDTLYALSKALGCPMDVLVRK